MPRSGESIRVDTGIFKLPTFYRVVATYRGRPVETRFPLHTGLRTMRDWQAGAKARLRKQHAPKVVFGGVAGTLSADVKRYLSLTTAMASWKSQRSHLHAWTQTELGSRDRLGLLPEDIRMVVNRWLAARVKPKTVRNRLVALTALYHLLDGDSAEPPTRGVTVHVPRTRPVRVSVDIIKAVDAQLEAQERAGRLRDAKTRARYRVLAATGIRPSQLMRVQPIDVEFNRRTWLVAGAKGGEPIGFYLNDDMLAAWQLFAQAQAWGAYDTRSFARTLRTAGWPRGIRPYNLRHAIGQDLSERGEDLQDIADWLGHRDVATTRAFYVPVLNSRLQAMAQRVDGRLGWGTGPQLGPQFHDSGQSKSAINEHKGHKAYKTKRA